MRSWLSGSSLLPASLLFLAVQLGGCLPRPAGVAAVPAPADAPASAGPPGEAWVDASAPGPGDGSRDKPFKSLARALEPGRPAHLHLRSGLYAGPFALAPGAWLEGQGQVVLFVEGEGPAVEARGAARLSGLTVQGGATGIDAEGALSLESVELSGQRRTAVRLRAGTVEARGCVFQASIPDTSGLLLEAGTRARVEGSRFLGPYWRAVHARGAERVSLEDVHFEGPVTGLHQVGGDAVVRHSTFEGGRGPALFVARASLRVEEVAVRGHEYALQTRRVSPLRVLGFTSVGAERAGISTVESQGELEDVVLVDSGPLGGLQPLDSDLIVRRLRVHRPASSGVSARGGKLGLEQAVFTQVRDGGGDAGNAVELRQVAARVDGLTVEEAAGVCVLVAQDSKVALHDAWLSRCRWAGVMAETLGRVDGASVTVRRSPGSAVAIPGDGEVRLYRLSSEKNVEGAIWAECDSRRQGRAARGAGRWPAQPLARLRAAVAGGRGRTRGRNAGRARLQIRW